MSYDHIETIVIGAGQAGLAVGRELSELGRDVLILEANNRIGQSWRERWDSLRLFTPAGFTRLPGMAFPAPRGHLPSKDEMADYLESYAARFALPVRLGMRVQEVTHEDRHYLVRAGAQRWEAEHVVVATGPSPHNRVPDLSARLDPTIRQLHAAQYRNPGQLPDGPVLVAGAGNSGAEIALDVAPNHHTYLAGRDTGRIPVTIGGFAYRLIDRLMRVDNPLGRRFAAQGSGKGTPLVRVRPEDLDAAGVQRVPRVAGVGRGLPLLDDGRSLEVNTVLWCTGYLRRYPWIRLPVFDEDGEPRQSRGVVPEEPGLCFLGLPYLSAPSSALVGGVGADARHVARQIAARARHRGTRREETVR